MPLSATYVTSAALVGKADTSAVGAKVGKATSNANTLGKMPWIHTSITNGVNGSTSAKMLTRLKGQLEAH
ncbi:hypothetical protein [Arthrobacter sp. AD-310]